MFGPGFTGFAGGTRRPPLHVSSIVFPLGAARVAAPAFALDRHGDSQEGAQVGHRAIEFLKIYIERLALGAARLLVESHAVYVHSFEDGLVK